MLHPIPDYVAGTVRSMELSGTVELRHRTRAPVGRVARILQRLERNEMVTLHKVAGIY